jgi:hypothetical protein
MPTRVGYVNDIALLQNAYIMVDTNET